MKNRIFVVVFMVTALASASLADINGKIVDTDGNSVKNASVKLLSSGESTLTDSVGNFSFALTGVIFRGKGNIIANPAMFKGDLFDLRGREMGVKGNGAGKRSANKAYVARDFRMIRVNRFSGKKRILSSRNLARTAMRKDETEDSLIISRKGYIQKRVALPASEEIADIVITPANRSIAAASVSSDYASANLDIISAEDYSSSTNLLPSLHTDIAVKTLNSSIYLLERFGKDNVIKFDSDALLTDYQENLGSGLNIQDIALVNETKAYISSYQTKDLIVFNPETGEEVTTIDLSDFNTYAGSDSSEQHPFMSSLAVYENRLYVACQRMKTVQTTYGSSFEPADTSLIVVIDTESDRITGSIALEKKNPASMDIFHNRLLVSSTGSWSDATDGGVEMIDLEQNENLGVVAEEGDFGGNITNVAFVSLQKAYVCSMSSTDYSTGVIPFNPAEKSVGSKIEGVVDGFGGLVYDGFDLYVGDRDLGEAGVDV
ncbi:MAG: hypothetical protein ACLFVQ_04585, partial [Chitinispirillaceae bacterium]